MANLLTNGTFASGMASWTASPSGVATVVSGEAVLVGSASATHQLLQSGFAIASGTSYHFSAQIRGLTGGKQIRAELVTNSGSSPLGLSQIITTTTSNVTADVTFTASATTSNARLRFRLINQAETAYIDNVVVEPATSILAGFTGTPTTGNATLSVAFTNTSTGSPTGFNWEYSKDGGAWTSFSTSSGSPTYGFTATGTYDIRLTVTKTTETNVLTRTGYIIVSGGIVAGFTGTPLTGAITLTTTFTDASTATNGITTRTWYYNRNGAGWTQFSTSTNPVQAFTLGGTYDIRLTIVGPDGTSTLDRLAYVTATGGVVAGFTGTPLSGAVTLTPTFTDASSGTIVSRIWEYRRNGGSWVEFSTSTNPSLALTQAGTYDIRLTVSSSSSTDTLTREGRCQRLPLNRKLIISWLPVTTRRRSAPSSTLTAKRWRQRM
jgi:PKD repeat protein